MLRETDWLAGQHKPARPGLYKRQRVVKLYGVKGHAFRATKETFWSWWNGQMWGLAGKTPQHALRLAQYISTNQELPWKGIAYDQAIHG